MNTTLANILTSGEAVKTVREGLPLAFEIAEFESRRIRLDPKTNRGKLATGQEVGFLRERVLLGFLRSQLGIASVHLPGPDQRFVGTIVAGRPLDFKTVTKRNRITVKWTADNSAVDKVFEDFRFAYDMLLVRIWWGLERDSLFYIPLEVLSELEKSNPEYLHSSTGTNNRGVKVKNAFMKEAEEHPDTVRVSIKWDRKGGPFTNPIDRYDDFWNKRISS